MNQKRDRIEKATALKFAKVYKLSKITLSKDSKEINY